VSIGLRAILVFATIAATLFAIGTWQSWSVSLAILNLCLISAIMALGLNMQWGYAGLFNAGVMAFVALGGVAAVLVAQPPVPEAWAAGGRGILAAAFMLALTCTLAVLAARKLRPGRFRQLTVLATVIAGFASVRLFFDPASVAIEAVDPSRTGYLGGLGLPILLSWLVGAVFAGAAAWLIGRIALGLRSDYFAIATLGISEIVIAVLKNEDWLTRGVKNVSGLPRPVPFELELQGSAWFGSLIERLFAGRLSELSDSARAETLRALIIDGSGIFVKLAYAGLFLFVLALVFWGAQRALASPWGRMMRAIRDNELAANAMGKDVTQRHREIFIIGAAVTGLAGAMLTTLDGQFTPGSYQPLRFTFLVWVMVIVGGSGNNLGAVVGGFLIWLTWVEAEPLGLWLAELATSGLATDSLLRTHLMDGAPHLRLFLMGLILLVVLRFSPNGLIPERSRVVH